MNRRDAFNTGGFKSMEVTGGPGSISIIGIPIQESPEGGGAFMFDEESDKVDVLSQEADGSFVFRTPLVKDLYNVDQKYVDATSAEMAGKKADSDWDSNPRSVQLEYREKLADSDPKFAEKDDQGEFKISDEQLKEMHRKEAEDGWNTFHEEQVPFSMVSNTPMISDSGATLYKLKDDKGKDTTIGLFTGGERREVTHLGTTGSGENTMIVYEYTDPDDPNRVIEASVPFNTAEGYALMEDAGYVGAIAKLVAEDPNLSIEDLRDQFGTTGESAGDETTTTGAGTGEGGEGTGEGGEGAESEEQQATPAPDTIGEFRAALNQTADRFEIRASRDKKLAQEIINEPPSVQIRRINDEIAAIEKELEETPRFKRGAGSKFRRDKAALERLKELRDQQPTLNEETKNRRIDEIDKQIADIKEQQLELRDRFEKEGGTNRNLVQRESLNNQLLNLEEQRSALDLFGRGAEIREQFGAPDGPAIQGEGPGIAYSKLKPPQDISLLESGNASSGSTKEERQLAFDEATRMAREAGHPFPEVVAAQFAKESAWGKNKGADFNYFGMKSSPAFIERLKEAGIEVKAGDEVETDEYIDGKKKTIKDSFLAFNSPEDAFMAYLMFIDTTKKKGEGGVSERRYGEALDESETAYDYIKGIIEAGYATTPPKAYADSINSIAKTYGFDLTEIGREPAGTASN